MKKYTLALITLLILFISFNEAYSQNKDIHSPPPDSILFMQAYKALIGINTPVDYEKAKKMLNYLAEKNNAEAHNLLGRIYREGLGVEVNRQKAAKYFENSYQLGSSKGTVNYINVLRTGYGIKRDYKLAFNLAKEHSEKGNPRACYSAGEMMLKGLGTPQNYDGARAYFEKGAELGNTESIYMLGIIYMKGYGVQPDSEKSKEYLTKAMYKGHKWVERIIEEDGISKEEARHEWRNERLKNGNISKLDTLFMFPNDAIPEEIEGEWIGKFYTYDWSGKELEEETTIKITAQATGDELWLIWDEGEQFRFKMTKGEKAWWVKEVIPMNGSDKPKNRFSQLRLNLEMENEEPVLYGNVLRHSSRTGDRLLPSAFALNLEKFTSNQEHDNLTLFPNPFKDEFNVKIFAKKEDVVIIEVFDIQGKLIIKNGPISLSKGLNLYPIRIDENAPGIYVVQVTGKSISEKEVVIKKSNAL